MVGKRSLNTIIESIAADGGHAIGDGDRGKPCAIIESIVADGSDAIGNNGVATSYNQRAC